jgi:small subunit ribosomal protein S20
MPTTKSGKKRLRQSLERRAANRAVKSAVKTQVRKVREAVDAGDVAKAEAELRLAAKRLDRAGIKRVIHPNAAARTKSRLSHLIKAAKDKGVQANAAAK